MCNQGCFFENENGECQSPSKFCVFKGRKDKIKTENAIESIEQKYTRLEERKKELFKMQDRARLVDEKSYEAAKIFNELLNVIGELKEIERSVIK